MAFNFLCVCVCVCPSAEKSGRKTSVFRGVVSLFFGRFCGWVWEPAFFFERCVCVCCLVMMIKHAGRKYSIPTKPKKASKQTAGRSAAVRRRVTAFLEKRAQPLLTTTTTLLKFRPLHSSYSKLVYFFLYSSWVQWPLIFCVCVRPCVCGKKR